MSHRYLATLLRKRAPEHAHVSMSMRPGKSDGLKRLTSMSNGEDDRDIDFQSAGLYLVGIQVLLSTQLVALSSILSCWLLPTVTVSAVRTLVIATAVGVGCVHRPLRVGRVRGVTTIFNALRPSVLLYIQVQIIEQLVHTCVPPETETDHGMWRRAVFHAMLLVMTLSGFIRARMPRSESDLPFVLTAVCLVVVAVFPPPPQALSGPLCSAPTVLGAAERMLRAFLFSTLYIVHVYAAAPSRNAMNELTLCVLRCAAASVWVLGATAWVLPLSLFQVIICAWTRFSMEDGVAFRREETLPFNNGSGYESRSETDSDMGSGGHFMPSHIPGLDSRLSMLGALNGLPPTPAQLMGCSPLALVDTTPIDYETYEPENGVVEAPEGAVAPAPCSTGVLKTVQNGLSGLSFNLSLSGGAGRNVPCSVSGGTNVSTTLSADAMQRIADRM